MILLRDTFSKDGIFGTLRSGGDEEICKTLEHAYPTFGKKFKAKIPVGTFMCVRGVHRLSRGEPFETFEVIGVDGHSGLLFHPGNFNADSNGCILLGEAVDGKSLVRSRVAFMTFMLRLKTAQSFSLDVIGG